MSDNSLNKNVMKAGSVKKPKISSNISNGNVDVKDDTPINFSNIHTILQAALRLSKTEAGNACADDGWIKYKCLKCGKKVANGTTLIQGERVYDCENCGKVKDVSKEYVTVAIDMETITPNSNTSNGLPVLKISKIEKL